MACSPIAVGQCSPQFGEFEGFPICCPPIFNFPDNPVDTFGKHPECFLGMPGSTAGGLGDLVDLIGCDTGCIPCGDEPDFVEKDFQPHIGRRWLLPDPNLPRTLDAHGALSAPRSHVAHLIADKMNYLRGTCWSNQAQECFGTNVCSCYGDNKAREFADANGECGAGATVGDPVVGLLPDEFFYMGHLWPLRDAGDQGDLIGTIYCRTFLETAFPIGEPRDHRVLVGIQTMRGIPEPVFLRTTGCAANEFIYCAGKVDAGGTCPAAFANNNPGREFYNEDESRLRFNFVRLVNRASFKTASNRAIINPAKAALKNKVLEFVRTHSFAPDGSVGPVGQIGSVSFDQMDHQLPVGGNGLLGQYQRAAGFQHLPPLQRPEVPGVFGPSFLKATGCPIEVQLRIDGIIFAARMIADLNEGAVNQPSEIEPHARALIQIQLSVTATAAGGNECMVQLRGGGNPTVTLELVNDPGVQGVFSVAPAGADVPNLRDTNGNAVEPETLVEWIGWLGYHSEPFTSRNQRFPLVSLINDFRCNETADGLSLAKIPGYPTSIDRPEGDAREVYGGYLQMIFDPVAA